MNLAFFSAGPGRDDGPPPTTPPLGLGGSGVYLEHSANDSASDDIYRGFFHPVGYSSVKIVDDGGANWGVSPHPGVPNTMSLTISSEVENVDALAVQGAVALGTYAEARAALASGSVFIQFSVDDMSDAFHVFPAQEPPVPEVHDQSVVGIGLNDSPRGDIYEAVFGQWGVGWAGSNVYICDEDSLGLRVEQWGGGITDDTDGIILETDLEALTLDIDTDGDTTADTPMIFF